MPTFEATVELFGTTATGFRVPPEVVAALSPRRRPAVVVEVNEHVYRSTIAPYGDWFFLPLNRKNRASAGVSAGDVVTVDIELDLEPRIVDVPEDFTEALALRPRAAAAFHGLSYSRKRDYVDWITGATRADTRQRRVAKALGMLEEGRQQR